GMYLQGMDLFIFPSHFEGFGTVVIESQWIGLPTLASDVLPKETQITDCLEFMSLIQGHSSWENEAHEMSKMKRIGREKETTMAGYDIKSTYSEMEDFYLTCYEESEKELI